MLGRGKLNGYMSTARCYYVGDRATAESALRAIEAICDEVGFKAEPFMVPFLPNVLTSVADKKSKEVREAAEAAGPSIIGICSPQAAKNVQPFLFAGIAETNWQTKMWSLRLLGQFAEQAEALPPSNNPEA